MILLAWTVLKKVNLQFIVVPVLSQESTFRRAGRKLPRKIGELTTCVLVSSDNLVFLATSIVK